MQWMQAALFAFNEEEFSAGCLFFATFSIALHKFCYEIHKPTKKINVLLWNEQNWAKCIPY